MNNLVFEAPKAIKKIVLDLQNGDLDPITALSKTEATFQKLQPYLYGTFSKEQLQNTYECYSYNICETLRSDVGNVEKTLRQINDLYNEVNFCVEELACGNLVPIDFLLKDRYEAFNRVLDRKNKSLENKLNGETFSLPTNKVQLAILITLFRTAELSLAENSWVSSRFVDIKKMRESVEHLLKDSNAKIPKSLKSSDVFKRRKDIRDNFINYSDQLEVYSLLGQPRP